MPGVVPWAFHEDFGAGAVTWYHSHAADVIQYALGMENSGPVEVIHPSSGTYPTLTFRYANGALLHHVDDWRMVKDVYKAVPATARLEGNFGGIFVGEVSPEALGDYVAGPSHVMPTSGTARFSSPLGVHHFLKVSSLVALTEADLKALGPSAAALARAEGLTAHARAVEQRLERLL